MNLLSIFRVRKPIVVVLLKTEVAVSVTPITKRNTMRSFPIVSKFFFFSTVKSFKNPDLFRIKVFSLLFITL